MRTSSIELHVRQALDAAVGDGVPLAGAADGDARALPHAEASFDAVLLRGPLSHLQEREDRLRGAS